MPIGTMRSYSARPGDVEQKWYHVDASDQVLGRLASKIAMILMGKNKPTYTPHIDTGDFVVVTNAEKIRVTGSKLQHKFHDRYTYYPAGRRVVTWEKVVQTHPERLLSTAVRRMLPKNALARHMLKKLKVYSGPSHKHQAQQPVPLNP